MSDTVMLIDDYDEDSMTGLLLTDVDEMDEDQKKRQQTIRLDSRRRLEQCLEERRLAKDLQDFDFDS